MPLYEYQCKKCDRRYEAVVSLGQADNYECPECGIRATRLFPSRGNFHLKGRGWARDGYGYPSPREKAALV